MSQWAIDGDGRSGDIFSSMKNAVLRRVKLNLLFNNHEDSDRSSGYSPHDLKKKAKWHDQVVWLTCSSLCFWFFGLSMKKLHLACSLSRKQGKMSILVKVNKDDG